MTHPVAVERHPGGIYRRRSEGLPASALVEGDERLDVLRAQSAPGGGGDARLKSRGQVDAPQATHSVHVHEIATHQAGKTGGNILSQ